MIIETSRTVLRRLTADDLDDVAAIFANPQVMKYLGETCQPLSREETKQILESIDGLWQRKNCGRMAVVYRQEDRLIGVAGLRFFESDAELFYLLDEPYWGRGLATEIGGAVLRYGFATHGFPRIIAVTRPANEKTLRVLDKIGLKFEKSAVIADVFAHIYQISKEEFEKLEK
jgi:[ribosomal protein S5]-alanine N-acetyltransferase